MTLAKDYVKRLVQSAILKKPYFANSIALTNFSSYLHKIKSVEIELSVNARLGKMGETIHMPIDNIILPKVLSEGEWEPEVIDSILRAVDLTKSYDLIDIGANCGLFTRQLLLSGISVGSAVCIEPDAANFSCLQKNLNVFHNVMFFNFGLGYENSRRNFFKDNKNHGNNSFIKIEKGPDAMRNEEFNVLQVEMKDTNQFFCEIQSTMAQNIIWKSDVQGFDEIIISLTPDIIWDRVKFALVELTRVSKPDFNKEDFAKKILPFKSRMLGPVNCSVEDIMNYIDNVDGDHKDLFLAR